MMATRRRRAMSTCNMQRSIAMDGDISYRSIGRYTCFSLMCPMLLAIRQLLAYIHTRIVHRIVPLSYRIEIFTSQNEYHHYTSRSACYDCFQFTRQMAPNRCLCEPSCWSGRHRPSYRAYRSNYTSPELSGAYSGLEVRGGREMWSVRSSAEGTRMQAPKACSPSKWYILMHSGARLGQL